MRITWMLVLLAVLGPVTACAAAETPPPAAAQTANCDCATTDWKFPFAPIARFDDLKEPSGIVFYPQLNALFVAGDKGHLTQLGLNGEEIRHEKILDGASFEGITFNPDNGFLYLALEGHDRVYEVDPATFQILHTFELDRMFEDRQLINPGGNGLEGITFVPGEGGGSFYFTNQSDELSGPDPSIVFEGKIDDSAAPPVVKIVRYFLPGVTDLSDIWYNAATQQLMVISDDNNLLLLLDLAGTVQQTFALPGHTQEGLTLDNNGVLYIAQDDGQVIKYLPVER